MPHSGAPGPALEAGGQRPGCLEATDVPITHRFRWRPPPPRHSFLRPRQRLPITPLQQELERLATALADRYRITRELGAGGMATVYLAEDLRHDRKVAIKVLRPELAAVIGAERFLSEIRTTANLQHPHILPLFDSGQITLPPVPAASTGPTVLFYVMPFVEGESLRDRLTREKQLPIADAVRIGGEVASALDYAHRRHIIHRDIKPENILLHDGRALVADFGIALAASTAGSRMTETGMSLGTPTYMSPEQAMGERTLDARTDVYALGCVCYEMLVGDPPFLGSTAQAIVAKVMTERPAPPSRLRQTIPAHVEDAVLTALEKLPADRFATAAALAAALGGADTHAGTSRGAAAARSAAATPQPWRRVSAALGMLVLGLAGLAAWALGRPPSAAAPEVFDAALPDSAAMSFAATTATTAYGVPLRNLSVSPAGDFVVYAASVGDSTALWYRSLRDASAHRIGGTTGGTAPRISPDGSRVAFLVGGRAMLVPVAGGEPRRLRDGQAPMFLEWVAPTTLLIGDLDAYRLTWVDPEAGQPRTRSISRCGFGAWIAESGQLICTLNGGGGVLDPETGERWAIRVAQPDGSPGAALVGSGFRIVEGRYLVYFAADGELRAAAFDPVRHLAGRSVAVASGIRREAVGEPQFDLTASGTLVYAPGADATVGRIVRIAPGTPPTPLPVEPAEYLRFDLSRDRRWLAAVVQTSEGQELRIFDLRDGQRFTWLRGELIRHALWSPDGERLMVGVRDSARWSLIEGVPGAGRAPDTLYSGDIATRNFDGIDYRVDTLALAQDASLTSAVRFNPARRPVRFDSIATGTRFVALSPDGRHIAYGEESGRIVITTPEPGGRLRQLATDGTEALWLSSTEVLYRSGVSWHLARIDAASGEPVGAATFWARDPRFSDTPGWSNRPSHDGGIIYLQGPAQVSSPYLRVVPNWVARMRRAVDAANR